MLPRKKSACLNCPKIWKDGEEVFPLPTVRSDSVSSVPGVNEP